MCVAILRFQPGTGLPVAVGFNRDEDPARDTGMPEAFTWRGRRVLAAREPLHGGTWLGVNAAGLVVGLLNRTPLPRVAGLAGSHRCPDTADCRSRGLLVLDCLRHATIEGVREELRAPLGASPRRALAEPYAPFNLFAVDGESALAAYYEGGAPDVFSLAPGLHVFAHGDVNDLSQPKVTRVQAAVSAGFAATPTDAIASFTACLSMHAEDPASEASPCRHGARYRTLCSTLVLVERGRPLRGRFLHAPGFPCTTAYRDLTPRLERLGKA